MKKTLLKKLKILKCPKHIINNNNNSNPLEEDITEEIEIEEEITEEIEDFKKQEIQNE